MNLYTYMDRGESNIEQGRGEGGRGNDKQRAKHKEVINVPMPTDPLSVALLSNLPKRISR